MLIALNLGFGVRDSQSSARVRRDDNVRPGCPAGMVRNVSPFKEARHCSPIDFGLISSVPALN